MGSNATWRCVPGRPATGPNHAVKGHGLNLGIRHLDRAWSLVGSAATPSGVDGFMGLGFRWCRFAQPPATGCHPSGMEGGMRLRTGVFPAMGFNRNRSPRPMVYGSARAVVVGGNERSIR